MRILFSFFVILGLALAGDPAQAETLSGSALKSKLENSVLMLSRNGRKTRRRLEITLNRNGTGQSLNVASGQAIPVTWRVKGRNLCLTQTKDKKTFCMATAVEGDKIIAQMTSDSGKTNQLKGSVTPF